MAEVTLERVEKRYGSYTVVPHLDLKIDDGEFAVLVGPSGCGKTTTLQMMAGLETISSGRLFIGGRDVTVLPPKERDIAMVFQSYALFPHMNVRDNINFGLKIRRTPAAEMQTMVSEVARRLQIDSYLDRLPKELSGGSGSVSPSRARWCGGPASSSWTNRCPISTPSCASRHAVSSARCTMRLARRRST